MRFKTHSERVGDLMFAEHESLGALHAALVSNREDLLFDNVLVLIEDKTKFSGWAILTKSYHIVDTCDPDTRGHDEENDGEEGGYTREDLYEALDGGAFVRWMLFSDDDALGEDSGALDMCIPIHGTNCKCPGHARRAL